MTNEEKLHAFQFNSVELLCGECGINCELFQITVIDPDGDEWNETLCSDCIDKLEEQVSAENAQEESNEN